MCRLCDLLTCQQVEDGALLSQTYPANGRPTAAQQILLLLGRYLKRCDKNKKKKKKRNAECDESLRDQ